MSRARESGSALGIDLRPMTSIGKAFHFKLGDKSRKMRGAHVSTGMELFIGSKVQCVSCFEICAPEGRRGEKGGSGNFKTKHTGLFTQEIP